MGEGPCAEMKTALEQAHAYLDKGQYDNVLLLLKKLEQNSPSFKDVSELVSIAEVCFAATKSSCSCTKSQQNKGLDWYLILKIEENAEIDVIRRRYRQLALLLHPDKNKHPKAETAFKLVSEAYACLSDKRKRAVFNAERSKFLCKICSEKLQKQNHNFTLSASGMGQHAHKHSKNTRLFAKKNGSSPEKSDEERLRMFRERARARVNSTAQAWKDTQARFKEEFQTMNNIFQCRRVNRKEMPTFDASESQFPNYPHRRVPVEKAICSEIPLFKDSESKFLWHTYSRNISTSEARSRWRGEKLETPIYEEPTGKKVLFSGLKRNFLHKDLKNTLNEQQAFCREPLRASRNLEGLLQKLRMASWHDARQYGIFHESDNWSRNKMGDNKNSMNVKDWYYNRGSETSETDGEGAESLDWDDCVSNRLPHVGEDRYRNVARKKLPEESNPPIRNARPYLEVCDRTSEGIENVVSAKDVRRPEELLNTLEHLREEAKGVAATLEKLRRSVGMEEDRVVRNFLCQKRPVAAGS